MEGVEMSADFWEGKTVLVTGHTGFKGGWVSLWLQRKGAKVCGYALEPPSTPSFFDVCDVADGMSSTIGDIRDYEFLKSTVKNLKPEIVIHMAAQALVRESYKNPVETIETNVMGTANILEVVRQTDCVRVVLIITSDKCYENREWLWGYREADRMGGRDPYSSSKGCAELITAAFRKSYFPKEEFGRHGVAVASARAGNVIGGGDWGKDRLVPDIVRAKMKGIPVEIRYPHAVRPWQHVLDPLDGYLSLIERLWEDGKTFAGGWNFGPNDSGCKPVSWILATLNSLWKGGVKWETDQDAVNPHEAHYLKLDCSKAATNIDWHPKLDIGSALTMVVEWYEGHSRKENMRDLSIRQLSRYENME
jgi:CDP-glucose 4,6-dehydratase